MVVVVIFFFGNPSFSFGSFLFEFLCFFFLLFVQKKKQISTKCRQVKASLHTSRHARNLKIKIKKKNKRKTLRDVLKKKFPLTFTLDPYFCPRNVPSSTGIELFFFFISRNIRSNQIETGRIKKKIFFLSWEFSKRIDGTDSEVRRLPSYST